MNITPPAIRNLILEFHKLPGIGAKTAERFVYYLLRQPPAAIDALVQHLTQLKENMRRCERCFTYTEQEKICAICRDPQRNQRALCVVAEPKDVATIEQAATFQGIYHVLGGVIRQLEGIGPDQLRIRELVSRVQREQIQEIIIATNPDMEGETTALVIAQQLRPFGVVVSKMARGLPTGADIAFADETTLRNALLQRQKM